MSYGRISEVAHEWIGISIVVIFEERHLLNSYWIRSAFKGKYNSLRIIQMILVIRVF